MMREVACLPLVRLAHSVGSQDSVSVHGNGSRIGLFTAPQTAMRLAISLAALAAVVLDIVFFLAPDGWAQKAVTLPNPSAAKYFCTFQRSWTECGFAEQAKVAGRASLVEAAGMRGVRLHTKPGDSNVAGSGINERNDLQLRSEEHTSELQSLAYLVCR